jgi:hypothetical protein
MLSLRRRVNVRNCPRSCGKTNQELTLTY